MVGRPILSLKKPVQVVLPPGLKPAAPAAKASPNKAMRHHNETVAALKAIRAAYPKAFAWPVRPLVPPG